MAPTAMARSPYTPQQRARALELYLQHGASVAARRCAAEGIDVKPGTISMWASRADVARARRENLDEMREVQIAQWQERRADLANKCGAHAEHFADLMRKHADAGDVDMVKALVPAFGVMVDKAQLLTGGVTARDEQVRTSAEQLRAVTVARVRELRPEAAALLGPIRDAG